MAVSVQITLIICTTLLAIIGMALYFDEGEEEWLIR